MVFFQVVVKLTTRPHFKDNVDVLIIIKVTIHLDNVRMIEIHLDLEFSDELLGNFFLQEKTFLNYLKGTDESGAFLSTLPKIYLTR